MEILRTIGVAGQKRNGKNELADYLATRTTYPDTYWDYDTCEVMECLSNWGRSSFASEVKRIFCETFFFDPADIDKWKVLDEPPPGFQKPVRDALTFIGDGFREIMGDVWIRRAFRDKSCYHKIFSDVRYLNEVRKIREVGGPTILICHPDRINYIANRSESELRPYVEWCLDTGREGVISTWPEFQAGIQLDIDGNVVFAADRDGPRKGVYVEIPVRTFFRNLSLFDVFIRNEGTVQDLHEKADNQIIPYIKANFDYAEAA